MTTTPAEGGALYHEWLGEPDRPLVVLIAGLGGAGATWGSQVERFARRYRVLLPDQRGTGRSPGTAAEQTIARHAADVAALLEGLGPAHVVGTSTGGAIAQRLALNHPDRVRSLTLASSWARADAYLQRELRIREALTATADPRLLASLTALLLFSPGFDREHPDEVEAWVERVASAPLDREIAVARLRMLLAHDELDRLGEIRCPALVLCGTRDACTPPELSEELAARLPSARLALLPGGHQIHAEQPERFFETVDTFLPEQPVTADPLGPWRDFLVAEAGAVAALAGLLFVAVSINLARILEYPYLPARAAEALAAFLSVLLVASCALAPQPPAVVGAEIGAIGLATWALQSASLYRSRGDPQARPLPGTGVNGFTQSLQPVHVSTRRAPEPEDSSV